MLARTKIFSIFTEFRTGKIKGLRAYIDYMPKAVSVVSETGAKTNISFQRYVFGYAFTIKSWDSQLRFNIIPKIGFWNLRSDLPLYSGDVSVPTEVLPFDLKNKPAGNLEFDAEYEPVFNLLTRVYVSSGIGIGLSTDKDRTLVSSQRLGAELTWTPTPSSSSQKYKLGYMISGFQETNTLKKVDTPEDPNVPYIGAFSYPQTFREGCLYLGETFVNLNFTKKT